MASLRAAAFVLMLAHLLAMPLPAAAQDSDLPEEAERLMSEGIANLMEALGLLLKTVPQYAAPEMMPNGDIIIRRLPPDDDVPKQGPVPSPDDDSTDT